MNKFLLKAAEVAFEAHSGQYRKYSGLPYSVHVFSVADITSRYTDDENTIAAAFLHDTIEDTDITYDDIHSLFNSIVADRVMAVTCIKDNKGSREERVARNIEHYSKASYEGQIIKASDCLHNLSDLQSCPDVAWALKYAAEKTELLDALRLAPYGLVQRSRSTIETIHRDCRLMQQGWKAIVDD